MKAMLRSMHPAFYFSKKDEDGEGDNAPKGFEKFFRNRNDRKKTPKSEESQS